MKVLWFTNTPPAEVTKVGKYNGGGWVSSLMELLPSSVELAVSYISNDGVLAFESRGVRYYRIPNTYDSSAVGRFGKMLGFNSKEFESLSVYMAAVVREFKPDLIEVFGSEHVYGMIAGIVDVPVVLHIQGILSECWKHFLPAGMSMFQYAKSGGSFRGFLGKLYHADSFRKRSVRESEIFATVKNYIGRTEWDRRYVEKTAPEARYYHLDEVLREPFYTNAGKWKKSLKYGRNIIVSTISEAPYKGADVVLKTARKLKESGMDFEWDVYGNVNAPFFEKFTGISAEDVNVNFAGVIDAGSLAKVLCSASVYVHPSYIENSPNSLCEAQMVGVPSIATMVGGVPSIIENGKDGILVPAGDYEAVADSISRVIGDKRLASALSSAAVDIAAERHDCDKIINGLMAIYDELAR